MSIQQNPAKPVAPAKMFGLLYIQETSGAAICDVALTMAAIRRGCAAPPGPGVMQTREE